MKAGRFPAKPPNLSAEGTNKDRILLNTIIDYCHYAFKSQIKGFYGPGGKDAFDNFKKCFSMTDYSEIYENTYRAVFYYRDGECCYDNADPHMRLLMRRYFGVHDDELLSVDDIFLADVNEKLKSNFDIGRYYGGNFTVLRYAANSHPERMGRVWRAALEVIPKKDNQRHVRFRLRYRPVAREDGSQPNPKIVDGVVLPVGRFLYFTGIDRWTDTPFVMVTRHETGEEVQRFGGVLLSRHVDEGVFTARIAAVRADQEVASANEAQIGIMPESDLKEPLKSLANILRNQGSDEGRSVIFPPNL